jgi:predicted extracellular nuclease
MNKAAVIVSLFLVPASTNAGIIRITEYMYQGADGEFIEICNVGATPENMTGWSFDDADRVPGAHSLTPLGILAAGQCGIISEPDAAAFDASWGLGGLVPIAGSNINNLSRNDEINIYDSSTALVDRLTYGDQNFPGTIRTQEKSGWVSQAGLGANNPAAWTLSAVADSQNSYTGALGSIGSPGRHIVPEPTTLSLLFIGIAALAGRRGRRSK